MELAYSILTTMIHNGCRALKDEFLETGKSFQQRDKDNFDTYIYPPLDVLTVGINAIEADS